jgi:tetratricopeptide (TPR) repeat protein
MSDILLAELLLRFIEAEVHQDWDTMIESGEGVLRSNTEQEAIRIKTATVYNRRGLTHLHDGNLVNALSDFNRSIELHPTKEAYRNRGKVYYEEHQYKRALSAFNQAVQLDPKDTLSLSMRAAIYRGLGRYGEAEVDELQLQWEIHRSAGW